MNVGENIKSMRKLRGMSQSELAKQIGVTNTTISNYEKSVSKPNIETIEKLAEILKCKKTDLIGEDDMKRDIFIMLDAIDNLLDNVDNDELLFNSKPVSEEVRQLIKADVDAIKRKATIYCSEFKERAM